mmetsp:Transcript_91772/g.262401  ORF Transcript_91772/g.262401 Transcript_91772/m.262401 type:complete len:234 (-) Transcript_91772:256-957(-)
MQAPSARVTALAKGRRLTGKSGEPATASRGWATTRPQEPTRSATRQATSVQAFVRRAAGTGSPAATASAQLALKTTRSHSGGKSRQVQAVDAEEVPAWIVVTLWSKSKKMPARLTPTLIPMADRVTWRHAIAVTCYNRSMSPRASLGANRAAEAVAGAGMGSRPRLQAAGVASPVVGVRRLPSSAASAILRPSQIGGSAVAPTTTMACARAPPHPSAPHHLHRGRRRCRAHRR